MIPVPTSVSSQSLTDWVELSCVKSKMGRISRSDVLDHLSEYDIDGPEERCTSIWQELQRRSRALGALYPVSVKPTNIQRPRPWEKDATYVMLLLLGSAEAKPKGSAQLFEEMATLAMARYTGGRALRIGHPRKSPVPSSFSDLLKYLSRELGESLRRAEPMIADTKDCRADIIAWRPFTDARGSQLIILGQCATGANWTTKLTECNVDVWARYLEFVVPPLRAFATPFMEPDPGHWLEHGTMGGIAFDRIRLVEQLAAAALPAKLEADIKSLVKAELKVLPWDA